MFASRGPREYLATTGLKPGVSDQGSGEDPVGRCCPRVAPLVDSSISRKRLWTELQIARLRALTLASEPSRLMLLASRLIYYSCQHHSLGTGILTFRPFTLFHLQLRCPP